MKRVVILVIAVILLVLATTYFIWFQKNKTDNNTYLISGEVNLVINSYPDDMINDEPVKTIEKRDINDFDLKLLKLENNDQNLAYSPLSIRYALKMLEEAAEGESKKQITDVIGDEMPTKYINNSHLSIANALFIKNQFASSVKESFVNLLKDKYSANVQFDPFKNANSINNWINEKTLKIIPQIISDDEVKELQLALINAVAIDMDWQEKYLCTGENFGSYVHEDYNWNYPMDVSQGSFNDSEPIYSGMHVTASINNYDILTELGEENIRATVGQEYKNFLLNLELDNWGIDYYLKGSPTEENINAEVSRYLDEYIKEINGNYQSVNVFDHFSFADNEDEKVYIKDLKEYGNTKLQYIGIMPQKADLKSYIEGINQENINSIIATAKELKSENFKQGVITRLEGFIPKFDFEYELNLKDDLNQIGITNVFEQGRASLDNLTDDKDIFISDAKHKANIEFTQDGIKAAAVTMIGGAGGGEWFNYIYDVPVETIDISFDKPFMFLVRDVKSGEVWFVGTVYEPLLWENDTTKA